MNRGKLVFAQLMQHLPLTTFRRGVTRYRGTFRVKSFSCLDQQFCLVSITITELHRCCWQVELSFKWIKQHLRIKAFFGTSENAARSQIWIAVSAYVLVAIVKKATTS